MYKKDIIVDKSSDSGQSEDNKANQEDDFSESGKTEVVDIFAALSEAREKIELLESKLEDMQQVLEKDQKIEAMARAEVYSIIRPLRELSSRERNRAEILRVLLKDRGGRMLARDIRKIMGLSRSNFSRLTIKMESQGLIKKRLHPRHKNWHMIELAND